MYNGSEVRSGGRSAWLVGVSGLMFAGVLGLVFACFGREVVRASEPQGDVVRLGEGSHVYLWDSAWPRLPEGMSLGNTHGAVAVSAKGLIYFNTDSAHAIVVVDAAGHVVTTFGKELAGGLHGMTIVREGDTEFLYATHTGKHEVWKMTLDGRVVWRLAYPVESGLYDSPNSYRPTSVAVAPNGDLFVADGYGISWVHQYDAKRNYLRSFGGPGTEPGKFRTPHGLWIDHRPAKPELLVADRENHRLQRFDLEGNHLGVIEGMLRRPCMMYGRGDDLAIADLAGRVTLLDRDHRLLMHLGDNPDAAKRARNDIDLPDWRAGEFLSPHGLAWDADGNLYVLDWNRNGRVSKLSRQ